MKTSTQAQLNQLLAQLLTTADPKQMQHDRMQVAIKDTDLAARFHAFVNDYEVLVPQVTVPSAVESSNLIPLRSDIPLGTHKPQPMSKLFRNRGKVIFYCRDGNLDGWFVENSPECPAGTARLVKTPKAMTFRQMAQSATGLATESLPDLSRAIVEQNLYITPAQWDDAIGGTQNGMDILTSGYASFAFAKTGKKLKDGQGEEYDEVVVLHANRFDDGQWNARVDGLDDGLAWSADARLLLRNSP